MTDRDDVHVYPRRTGRKVRDRWHRRRLTPRGLVRRLIDGPRMCDEIVYEPCTDCARLEGPICTVCGRRAGCRSTSGGFNRPPEPGEPDLPENHPEWEPPLGEIGQCDTCKRRVCPECESSAECCFLECEDGDCPPGWVDRGGGQFVRLPAIAREKTGGPVG